MVYRVYTFIFDSQRGESIRRLDLQLVQIESQIAIRILINTPLVPALSAVLNLVVAVKAQVNQSCYCDPATGIVRSDPWPILTCSLLT